MEEASANPWVFFDMSIDGKPIGRIVFHLRADLVPIASENFRSLCTGWKGKGMKGKPLHYKNTVFHRIIPDRLISGGDVVAGDGHIVLRILFIIHVFFMNLQFSW